MATPITNAPEWEGSQSSPWLPSNKRSRIFDAFCYRTAVADRDLSAPPGTCDDGAKYLVNATGTGAWVGRDGEIAIAIGENASNGWVFAMAENEGAQIWIEDEETQIEFAGGNWNVSPERIVRFDDLADVVFTGVNDGDTLYWDASNAIWYAAAPGVAVGGSNNAPIIDASDAGYDPYGTFYVNASAGSDSDDGLTAGTAWATFDYAIAQLAQMRWPKWAGNVVLMMATGSYTMDSGELFQGFPSLLGLEYITVYSASGIAADVTIACGSYLINDTGGHFFFSDVTFDDIYKVICRNGLLHFDDCAFTNVDSPGVDTFSAHENGLIRITGTTTIACTPSGTFRSLFAALDGGTFNTRGTITITGSPTVSQTALIAANSFGNFYAGGSTTFIGTVTGPRYYVEGHSRLFTNLGGANYLPGTTAGVNDSGSVYDAIRLNDLLDVDTTGIADGYVLKWDQSNGFWYPSADDGIGGGGAGSSDFVHIESLTPSAVASIDSEAWSGNNYKALKFVFRLTASNDAVTLSIRYKQNGAYKTDANYRYYSQNSSSGGTSSNTNSNSGTSAVIGGTGATWGIGNNTLEHVSGEITIHRPNETSKPKNFNFMSTHGAPSGAYVSSQGGGCFDGTDAAMALEGLRFLIDAGTITGTIDVYAMA
jgi:Protein of unknown function (DUF2793)